MGVCEEKVSPSTFEATKSVAMLSYAREKCKKASVNLLGSAGSGLNSSQICQILKDCRDMSAYACRSRDETEQTRGNGLRGEVTTCKSNGLFFGESLRS